MLAAALGLAAFVAGVTGTWSPCGFSMIETIGGPERRVLTSCAAITLGACAGGVATFAALGAAGSLVPSRLGTGVALTLAVAGAVAEARNARIAPQIRRQVPERWRRTLPLPVAAVLYGILLGLGFTTFVLTFAFWAVAALTFGAGDASTGVTVGLAFGLGRALPVAAVAPALRRPAGVAAMKAMAERPAILRGVRIADAAALVLATAALFAADARAANNLGAGTDPTASGDLLAWTTSSGGVLVRGSATPTALPGRPALGGELVAWRIGAEVHVATATDLAAVADLTVPGIDALGISDRWLVTRERAPGGGDSLVVRPLAALDQPRVVASTKPPAELGRPAIDGDLLVIHVATRALSRILAIDLADGTTRVVRSSRQAQLTNPSVLAGRLLYVRQTSTAQLLELGPLTGGRDRVIYRLGAPAARDRGYEPGYSHHTRTPRPKQAAGLLWTTALSDRTAYVTFLPRKAGAAASIVAVPR